MIDCPPEEKFFRQQRLIFMFECESSFFTSQFYPAGLSILKREQLFPAIPDFVLSRNLSGTTSEISPEFSAGINPNYAIRQIGHINYQRNLSLR